MNIQKIVIELYPSVVKRISSWILPLMLTLLYLSGFSANSEFAFVYVSRIGLVTLHTICGFILIFALAVLVYNKIVYFPSPLYRDNQTPESGTTVSRLVVDVLFYLALGIISCLGLILYSLKAFDWDPIFIDPTFLFIMHVMTGSLFIALIPIKYYLSLMQWYKELLNYLRDEV